MNRACIFSVLLALGSHLPCKAQKIPATDIQFAKGAVYLGASFARPCQRPSPTGDNRSFEGYNNFSRVSVGYFPVQKLAIVPEIGLQTYNRPKADGITQIQLPDNLLTVGVNARYYFDVDPICGAFGIQVGYNSGKYLSGPAPLAHQINSELVIAKPMPFRFLAKKVQLDMGLGFISGDFAQRNNALYFSGRVGLNYYLNANKILAKQLGAQP